MKIRPFRILAAALMVILAAEIYGILTVPNYDAELAEAKAAYAAAVYENHALRYGK